MSKLADVLLQVGITWFGASVHVNAINRHAYLNEQSPPTKLLSVLQAQNQG
jgi:hypothetical protein